jgi:hypothetical protein
MQAVNSQASLVASRSMQGARVDDLEDTVEIRYFGMDNVYRTESFRCHNSDTRLYTYLPDLVIPLPCLRRGYGKLLQGRILRQLLQNSQEQLLF